MLEVDMVNLLLARNGLPTRVIVMDGEPMLLTQVVQIPCPLLLPADEHYRYAQAGGLALSGKGKYDYFFLSNEIARIEDVASGEVLFTR